jgi:hypothetical protein
VVTKVGSDDVDRRVCLGGGGVIEEAVVWLKMDGGTEELCVPKAFVALSRLVWLGISTSTSYTLQCS